MQEISLTLIKNSKSDLNRLNHTLENMEGLYEFNISKEENHLTAKIDQKLNAQHLINEINIHTGYKAF
ncbi:MAG TPA: hypothetical protein DHW82_10755 [Spirochaetia bacterium]|nr:MAG: hypothetical protein A2Y41_13275 [Spirochaetes bacterium GWB1_36_13]HCL57473.1 hypothetical protein [Spirochaetia bacterium]